MEYAYQIIQDPAIKFNYAIELEDIESCQHLLRNELNTEKEIIYNRQRWRQLADICIDKGNIEFAEECADMAEDLSLLLLLHSCTGNRKGIVDLAEKARKADQWNIRFLCYFLLQDVDNCREVLKSQGLLPQAAFFALSYQPSFIHQVFRDWQENLIEAHHIAAELIANPSIYSDYFPGYHEALELEESIKPLYSMDIRASEYPKYKEMLETGLSLSELQCVGEEEEEEDVHEEIQEEDVQEEVQEEDIQEEIQEETQDSPQLDNNDDSDEFGEIEGDFEVGDVDDLDIDNLEKEWE